MPSKLHDCWRFKRILLWNGDLHYIFITGIWDTAGDTARLIRFYDKRQNLDFVTFQLISGVDWGSHKHKKYNVLWPIRTCRPMIMELRRSTSKSLIIHCMCDCWEIEWLWSFKVTGSLDMLKDSPTSEQLLGKRLVSDHGTTPVVPLWVLGFGDMSLTMSQVGWEIDVLWKDLLY